MNSFSVANFNSGLALAAPEIFLGLAACVILMLDLMLNDAQRHLTGVLAVVALLVTAVLTVMLPVHSRVVALGGMFELDRLAQVLKVVTLLTVTVVFVYSTDYLRRRQLLKGEYYVLGLFATLGGMVLISAGKPPHPVPRARVDVAVPVRDGRIRPGFRHRRRIRHQIFRPGIHGVGNAAVRYVDHLRRHRAASNSRTSRSGLHGGFAGNVGLLFGIAFLIVGIGFKLGAVPFHMWIPDVYEGSPTCVTVFIGTASKLAAFALAMRLLPEALARVRSPIGARCWWCSRCSRSPSATSSRWPRRTSSACWRIRRSRTWAYILLGILSGTSQGYQAAMFYMVSYVVVAAGAFGMILLLARQGFEADKLTDFKGLNARSPWFAGMMAILMFSLAGLPPFVGFWAKLGVIQAVLNVNLTWLAVAAVLFSVVGAFFYLRIVKLMYFDAPVDSAVIGGSMLMRTVLSANALLVFALGVAPTALIALCQQALP